MLDRNRKFVVKSRRNIVFKKSESYIRLSDRYTLSSVRDPHVFMDASGLYHMLITTSLRDDGQKKGGWPILHPGICAIGRRRSRSSSPVIKTNRKARTTSSGMAGITCYSAMTGSRAIDMPGSRSGYGLAAMDAFDCVQLRVPKTAAFLEGRRIATAFLSEPGRYGGELVIRELVQNADGSIGLKWPSEFREQRRNGALFRHETFFVSNAAGEYAISFEVVPE